MYEIKEDLLPAEFIPIPPSEAKEFIDCVFPESKLERLRAEARYIIQWWHLMRFDEKFARLNAFQEMLYDGLCPTAKIQFHAEEPKSKTLTNGANSTDSSTYCGETMAALFHTITWQISFVPNYFKQASPSNILATSIHENFHGLLHFMSLCQHRNLAWEYMYPPYRVMQMAASLQINQSNVIASKIARKNLLGIIDRSWGCLDSYYLNVEITVDDLGELLYNKLGCFPVKYQRGYTNSRTYLLDRLRWQSIYESRRMKSVLTLS